MFDTLLRRLMAPAPGKLADYDAHLALAALLVRVARADERYSKAEAARIDMLLMQLYGLHPPEARALRAEAEVLESEAPDTVRFTRALKQAVPLADRTALIEAMWAVAVTEDGRAAEEEALLRLVANLLGLTDVESALARQRVDRGGA
jgi:uncharacterized tellurite resistance protein B-like protein